MERLGVRPRSLRERPGHRATTASVQAIYPFVTEASLGSDGVYLGRDLYGGSFLYDPFALYERRVLTNPNMLVIGEVGAAKSSLVKTYCYRQAVFGRRAWIGDPKGEYEPLARALGVEPIKLVPGGTVKLNPLDRSASEIQRLSLTQALTATEAGRRATPIRPRRSTHPERQDHGARDPRDPQLERPGRGDKRQNRSRTRHDRAPKVAGKSPDLRSNELHRLAGDCLLDTARELHDMARRTTNSSMDDGCRLTAPRRPQRRRFLVRSRREAAGSAAVRRSV